MTLTKCKMQILIDNMERVIEEFKIEFGIDSVITNKQYNYQRFYYHGIEIGCYFRDNITIAKKMTFCEGRIWDSSSVCHSPKRNYESFKNEIFSSIKRLLPLVVSVEQIKKEWTVQQMEKQANDDFS